MKNKFEAIMKIVRSEHYIVISSRGISSCTPKFGHKQYWKDAKERFKVLKKGADRKQEEI